MGMAVPGLGAAKVSRAKGHVPEGWRNGGGGWKGLRRGGA